MSDALLSVDEMRALVLAHCAALSSEELPLTRCAGRVLSESLAARRDLPGYDNSAMDGLGVRCADVARASASNPVTLRVVGQALPGNAAPTAPLGSGEAVRIMTGAPIPGGVEAVVMREQCDESRAAEGHIAVLEAAAAGQHIRRRGEDVCVGDVVGRPGDVVTPARLNLLLAAGIVHVRVVRAPRVAVLASGDELKEIGEPCGPSDVVNSNAHSIAAACALLGCEVTMLGIARDTLASHQEKIEQARAFDVLVTIGGVSAGTHDFVRPALAALGATLQAHKVAMRPGKPVAVALLGDTRVLGLPGNPVSALVSFSLFVAPALKALLGKRDVHPPHVEAVLLDDIKKKPGFEHYARARLGPDGARVLDKQGSHQISGLADANALVIVPREAAGARAGERVRCLVLEGG